MRKLLIMFMLFLATAGWQAQTAKASSPQGSAKEEKQKVQPATAADVYHLEFTVRELENGKSINSRKYTMSVWDHNRESVRVGSRIPYSVSENSVQYQDVGIKIDCMVRDSENDTVILQTNFESSSFVAGSEVGSHPVFRNVSSSDTSVVPLGKPTVISSLDDVGTTHRYELEVRATKEK